MKVVLTKEQRRKWLHIRRLWRKDLEETDCFAGTKQKERPADD